MTPPRTTAQNHKDFVTLKEYVEALLRGFEQRLEDNDRAVDIRLSAGVKEQIAHERDHYVRKVDDDRKHESIDASIRRLEITGAEIRGKASVSQLMWVGVASVFGLIIAAVGVAIGIFK